MVGVSWAGARSAHATGSPVAHKRSPVSVGDELRVKRFLPGRDADVMTARQDVWQLCFTRLVGGPLHGWMVGRRNHGRYLTVAMAASRSDARSPGHN